MKPSVFPRVLGVAATLLLLSMSVSTAVHPTGSAPSKVGPPWAAGPAILDTTRSPATPVRWALDIGIPGLTNITASFEANLTVPTGSIDQGTTLSTPIVLDAPASVDLTLNGLGSSSALPIPLLGSVGPIAIPGASYTYLGISFGVYITVETEIQANCSGSPAVSGCSGTVVWLQSGAKNVSIHSASTDAPGTRIPLDLDGIALALAVNLTAGGILLGQNISVPLASLPLAAYPGSPATLNASWEVTSVPSVSSVTASPSGLRLGSSTTLAVLAEGGSGPLSYRYSGLPTGCGSANAPMLVCSPNETGRFTVTVTATDPQGLSSVGQTALNVTSDTGPGTSLAFASPVVLVGIAVLACGAAVVSLFLWLRRRP